MRDPYHVLGVAPSATADEIKCGFRRHAKRLHPDANRNDPDATARFAELTAAYEILGNEEKRTAFDLGRIDAEGNPTLGVVPHATRAAYSATALSILAAMLILSASIWPLWHNSTSNEKKNGSTNLVINTVASAKSDVATHASEPQPRLVLWPASSRSTSDAVPLNTHVAGAPAGLALEISGLPTGMTVSVGRPLGEGRWRILARELDGAMIRAPEGFRGAVDLALELRDAEDTLVDSGSLHRDWPPAAPIESASKVAITEGSIAAATVTGRHGAQRATTASLDNKQIELLVDRSEKFISEGDLAAGRILLERAAEARDARAALALGATYDPLMLGKRQAEGLTANVSLARDWYKKASELGSQEAQLRLNLLAKIEQLAP